MKLSILTATYDRANYLDKLYNSIKSSICDGVEVEWLIMDDGSTDETKDKIDEYIKDSNFDIKYYYQDNQGKMIAINNLIQHVTGDLIVECDSDDYFTKNSFKIINNRFKLLDDEIYGFVFLKYDQNLCNIGNVFKEDNYTSTMFDLYFKDGLTGDKSIVFVARIRKQYKYILEKQERFSTEARMHNLMDKKYKILCFNQPIMICEYHESGYSENIKEIFKYNPFGYYEYFKQLMDFDMKGVLFSKRLYAIKHYILFSHLTKSKNILKDVKGSLNKFLVAILYVPGIVKTNIQFKK